MSSQEKSFNDSEPALSLQNKDSAEHLARVLCGDWGSGSPAHLSHSGTRAKAGRWLCLKGKRVPRVSHWNFKWVTDPLRCDGLGPVTWYHPPTIKCLGRALPMGARKAESRKQKAIIAAYKAAGALMGVL